jgi:hypothetical protein
MILKQKQVKHIFCMHYNRIILKKFDYHTIFSMKIEKHLIFIFVCSILFPTQPIHSQQQVRKDILLNQGWKTIADDTSCYFYKGFENLSFNDSAWEEVEIPHNWDQYEGYRREKHGNRHGSAWYRKTFKLIGKEKDKHYFLWFEGVGSYATVWLNGHKAGFHAGGRTSFTLDITELINTKGDVNILAVRADHPAGIKNLPWVCGGCSDEWGFSEGSQPLGIFRPVHLIVTNHIRIEPFGVHIWNDTACSDKPVILHIRAEIRNYGDKLGKVKVVNRLLHSDSTFVAESDTILWIQAGNTVNINQQSITVKNPRLWSPEDPYLYIMMTEVIEKGRVIDRVFTRYGIRHIKWAGGQNDSTHTFMLNGKSFFINGTAEYEHNMGMSHAFSAEQIHTRAMQVKAAGFNAFRDAHQPHNLLYQEYWDKLGILWWPQFSAHIWFDNPDFRANYKALLTDWIKERRNSPSVILWGLSNESALPEDFARECTELIRELDPTATSQRKITTCNGGSGTDWNVIQNWSGTYAGDPEKYDQEMKRDLLNGEYGGWRSIDLHTEDGYKNNSVLSENRLCDLMETKIRLAESVRDKCCGHFQWLFCSHENPGRVQNGEGLREIDRIGPINYKGLFTLWGEPLDVFYLYRANYAPKETEPMVYIVSHTWPTRWTTPGIKNNIIVYSNCDEVELFNDPGVSLGRKTRNGPGTHFEWDSVNIRYNTLYARGYVNGKTLAEDKIILNLLPAVSEKAVNDNDSVDITKPEAGYNYLYRVNCGGPDYKDVFGNIWAADRLKKADTVWGSMSWTDDFECLPPFYGSQRRTFDPVKGTADDVLFQTFRFGRNKLRYYFPVADGEYLVELFFIEPWYGTGGGMDCKNWRVFDVAVNDSVVLNDLDIWQETGHDMALKKKAKVKVSGGMLVISFPQVKSGQAIISAIAISTRTEVKTNLSSSLPLIQKLMVKDKNLTRDWSVNSWLDVGNYQYTDDSLQIRFLPSNLFGAEWIKTSRNDAPFDDDTLASFILTSKADVFVAMDKRIEKLPGWMLAYTFTGTYIENNADTNNQFKVYARRFEKGDTVLLGSNGYMPGGEPGMYTVVVSGVSILGQAQDQRPVVVYEAEDAFMQGNSVKKIADAAEGYVYLTDVKDDSLIWTITIGVGDTYILKFKFRNNVAEDIHVNIKITDAKENTVYNEKVLFMPSEKWSNKAISQVLNLNAGTYKVYLYNIEKTGLEIDALLVQ